MVERIARQPDPPRGPPRRACASAPGGPSRSPSSPSPVACSRPSTRRSPSSRSTCSAARRSAPCAGSPASRLARPKRRSGAISASATTSVTPRSSSRTRQAACEALRRAGIAVPKLQLSAALRIAGSVPRPQPQLRPFDEPVYLHQVIERAGERLDPPPRPAAGAGRRWTRASGAEWRVHFHVPIFLRRAAALLDHAGLPPRRSWRCTGKQPISPHLEVETYTWDVLPARYRQAGVASAIARELAWMLEQLRRMNWQVALRLGRVSNLPTVWTNTLAGIVLAGGRIERCPHRCPLLVALSLFYIAGMYLNDAFDAGIDARERPERPIPVGPGQPAHRVRAQLRYDDPGRNRPHRPGLRAPGGPCGLAGARRPGAWHGDHRLQLAPQGQPLEPADDGALPDAGLHHRRARGPRCPDRPCFTSVPCCCSAT